MKNCYLRIKCGSRDKHLTFKFKKCKLIVDHVVLWFGSLRSFNPLIDAGRVGYGFNLSDLHIDSERCGLRLCSPHINLSIERVDFPLGRKQRVDFPLSLNQRADFPLSPIKQREQIMRGHNA